MESARRRLGLSDLEISRVGMGTAPIGSSSGWSINWGHQDEDEAVLAIRMAADEGMNWIDTAPFYGWGRAEEIVGKAIAGRRDDVLVFTKCGTMNDGSGGDFMDLSPVAIRRDVHASLSRLNTDRVDLLQLHDPDPAVPIEESYGEVRRLIEEGLVRHGGLSNHPVNLIRRALAVGPVVAAQHRYNLLYRDIEREVLPFCRQHEIGVLSWSSLAEGLLTDTFDRDHLDPTDFRRGDPNCRDPRYRRIRNLVAKISAVASESGHSATDLAIAWLLSQEGMTGAIVGARSPDEARGIAAAADWTPGDDALHRVDQALTGLDLGVAPGA